KRTKTAFLICLGGNLGSGKTTFLQGLAEGLEIKERILSPTFLILRSFQIKKGPFRKFYHLDCYRLKRAKEIISLNLAEILKNSSHLVAIEWAEKIKKFLPKNNLWLEFKIRGKKKREIIIRE
ncbi:tRNA (adenosine(37)-N6)-threonylcarbamoyltransferase complex ATPase subunit type 1 TsaE, partial [Escherichia coli]|uniref:tRNA (adenosine(37)-N6)-threonylcarbamoyltransferase complex ATPase subunit type 1 TsaE n=1 Tax=Escherichia coli TaxID=562 RepID=UPI00128EA78F